jgi:hypothetical protein
MMAARLSPGAISESSSSHLPASVASYWAKPRRANALLLLDDGMSCEEIRKFSTWTMTRSVTGTNCIARKA